jgi:CHAT domain-containing protein/tetratricopeptide (TPR) repeat protein
MLKRLIAILFLGCICITRVDAQFNKLQRLMKRGDFKEAFEFSNNKISKFGTRRFGKARLQSYYVNLARINYVLGDYAASETEFRNSLKFADEKLKNGKRLKLRDFDAMDEFALFYVNTGNFQQARELIDKSLKLRVRKFHKNDPTNFRPYLPLGLLFFYQNQFDSARHYLSSYQKQIRNSNYTGFLDIDKYADTYQILSEIGLKLGNWTTAKRFAKKSARLQRHPWTKKQSGKNYLNRVRALNTLSVTFRLNGQITKAGRYNKKALSIYGKKYDDEHNILIPVYINKAHLAVLGGNIDTARTYLKKSIVLQMKFVRNNFSHLTEYEKENYSARLRENFNEISGFVVRLLLENKIDARDALWTEILNYTLNTKSLILSESNRLIEDLRMSEDTETNKLFSMWRNLKNEFAWLSGNFKKRSKEQAGAVLKELVEIEKILLQNDSSAVGGYSWTSVRSSLKTGEAAIEFTRIGKGTLSRDSSIFYVAFIIKSDSDRPEVVIYKEREQLEQRYIRYYFNSIAHRLEDTISYNVYWHPLVKSLEGVRTVYFSADGVFHLINPETLRDVRNNQFLMDDISIINVTSTRELVNSEKRSLSISSAALFGSPDFSNYTQDELQRIGFHGNVSPLPGTREEVVEINALLSKRNVSSKAFTDKSASEEQLFTVGGEDVLHLATHGFFSSLSDTNDPMLGSGLLLSKGSSHNDGILTAYEASALNLDSVKLVVLSACKSGLGQVSEGEGVYGLQRAFEVAGVDYILMTLWNVDDAATKEFMTEFYSFLMKEKDIFTAFKKARLSLKKKYPEVFYWGAFKLISS